MTIYVGRWDLLPLDWEGINGLYDKNRFEIAQEIEREKKLAGDNDGFIGEYYPFFFEDAFNHDLGGRLSATDYWIKII